MSQTNSQKQLGVTLDFSVKFGEHLLNIFKTVNRTTALLRKLPNVLPRTTLFTIYKAFARPHLDYEDILYNQDVRAGQIHSQKHLGMFLEFKLNSKEYLEKNYHTFCHNSQASISVA